MDQNQLFTLALGVSQPWKIVSVEFSASNKRLDILIDFSPGSRFTLGGESKDKNTYPAYDTVEKEWRHLDFFQHECYIKARTPRVRLDNGSVQLVTPPWAGREKGFTMLFEALLLQLLKSMPVLQVEKLCRIGDDKLWNMIRRYVDDARELLDMSMLETLGVDETSIRKGHNYVTVFVDVEQSKTLFVTEGKDSSTFSAFETDLIAHGGEAAQVSTISMDMSPAFIKGADTHFPNAQKVFDKFHIVKLFNTAIDKVRKQEQKELGKDDGKILKDARWAVLKNKANLTEKQKVTLASIEMHGQNLMTFKMLRMRESLQDIYRLATSEEDFEARLKALRQWLLKSRLEPAKELGRMMKEHWLGITSWFRLRVSNAILEGINSLIKAAAARARGYRTIRNYTTIIYLITGKLDFSAVNPALGKG